MAFDGYGLRAPFTALTRPRTVYVDSAAGNDDTGEGTQAKPWATLQRAWIERSQYLELRAAFTIQLIGAGPYDLDFDAGASVCSGAGRFFILGDPLAVTVLDSGTATGDLSAACVLPTTTVTGGPFPNEFLEITSGVCAGSLIAINDSAANTITVANRNARNALGAIVNGDAWRIIRPGTVIRMQNVGGVGAGISGWQGLQGQSVISPLHWIRGVRLVNGAANAFRVNGSELGLCFVRIETGSCQWSAVDVGCLPLPGSIPGAEGSRLAGAGFVQTAGFVAIQSGSIFGQASMFGMSAGVGGIVSVVHAGGRLGGGVVNQIGVGGVFEAYGVQQDILLVSTLEVRNGGRLFVGSGTWRAAVTAGSVLRIASGGQVTQQIAFTGGTIAAGGFGVDVRNGGRYIIRNLTPALTGGTAGSDLRTTNVAVAANSALNANNTAVGNAADALLGEVLCRVANN